MLSPSFDLDPPLDNQDPDAMVIWLLQNVREAVAPVAHLTAEQLEAHAAGRYTDARVPDWMTPPMARLQLRLRAILAEHGPAFRAGAN